MRKRWPVLLLVPLFILYFDACKKGPTQPAENQSTEMTEQEAIADVISNDALFTADQKLLDDGEPSSTSLKKGEAAVIPLKWGRKIESSNRSTDFSRLTDTTAMVTITNVLTGYIWIQPFDTTAPIIKKNFTETTTRIVKFIRIARVKDKRKNWAVSEVSAMKGGTATTGIEIQKVTFFIGSDTLQITDPLNYFLKIGRSGMGGMRSISNTFTDSLKVRVEIKSSDPDSDIVSAHRPYYQILKRMFRAPMKLVSSASTTDGKYLRVYENSWKGVWTGRHHAIVGAMTRESIFDDIKPLSSELWGIPFIVE
jgi:hypothetical protein